MEGTGHPGDGIELDRVEHYQVLRELGSGGFATAWLAFDPNLDRYVAIKVLRGSAMADPDVRLRFLQEAQLLSRARPTLAIGVHSRGELPDGRPYIVMEFAEGGSLEQRLGPLVARQPLRGDELRRLISDLGNCLRSLHQAGIVHRDIKPSNFLIRRQAGGPAAPVPPGRYLGPDEQLIVADLGVARLVTTEARSGASILAGTRRWSAPEQFLTTSAPTPAADLYSATLIVLWAATGLIPEIDEHLNVQIPRGLTADAGLGPRFAAAIARGCALQPAARFADADQWTAALLGALQTPDTVTVAPATRTATEATAKPAIATAFGAAVESAMETAIKGAVEPPTATPVEPPTAMPIEPPADMVAETEFRSSAGAGSRRWPVLAVLLLLAGVSAGGAAVVINQAQAGADRLVGPEVVAVGQDVVYYLHDSSGSVTWQVGSQSSTGGLVEFEPSSPGRLRIEASDESSTVSRTVEVVAARAASIDGPASLTVGQVGTYTVSGLDGRQVLWTADNAAVSAETATITPRSPGLVTLTATVEDEELVRQITVLP